MINYKCSKCGAELESDSSLGGQKDTCPLCRQVCTVPESKGRMPLILGICGGAAAVVVLVVAIVWLWPHGNESAGPPGEQLSRAPLAADPRPKGEPKPKPKLQPKPKTKRKRKTPEKPSRTVGPTPIVCDKFSVRATIEQHTLRLSLDTDLPDDTVLMVSVWRTYREKGDTQRYTIDYFSEKSTVGKWRGKRVIEVNNDEALRRFRAKREKLGKIDMAGQIESISDSIVVGLTVPVNQPNPAFGNRNENLHGRMVQLSKFGFRIVQWEKSLVYPVSKKGESQAERASRSRTESNSEREEVLTAAKRRILDLYRKDPDKPRLSTLKIKNERLSKLQAGQYDVWCDAYIVYPDQPKKWDGTHFHIRVTKKTGVWIGELASLPGFIR